jgi:hypothetical protein
MANNTVPPKLLGRTATGYFMDEEISDEQMSAFAAYVNKNRPKPAPEPYLNHASARITMRKDSRCWLDKHSLKLFSFACPDGTPSLYRFATFLCTHCDCEVMFETNGNVPRLENEKLMQELAYVEREGLKVV